MRKLILSTMVIVCAGTLTAQANMLDNPGFETAGSTSTVAASWTFYEDAGRETWAARTGSAGAALYSWNDTKWGGGFQDVPVNLVDGNVFSFSIYALAEEGFSSAADELFLKLEFKDSGATELYNVQESIYSEATADPNNWNMYTITHTNDNLNVASVTAVFGSGQWTATGGNESVKFDDAVFTQVPEPVSAALLAAGLGFIYLLRRKVQK